MNIRTFLIAALIMVTCSLELFAQRHTYRKAQHYRSAIHLLYEDDEEPAEDSIRGLGFGINLGGYFGSAKTANFYNGTCPIEGYLNEAAQVRCYTIAERLDPSVFIQDGAYINNYYGSQSYFLPYDAYPTNMRYNPAMSIGLQLKYNFNRYAALILNVNATKLVAAGQFTLQFVGTPAQFNGQSDVRLFSIAGGEQRMNINLGYRQGWMMGNFSNFYIQLGGSTLFTKYTKNTVFVADKTFDLITSAPVIGQTATTAQAQAGIGFGGYASTGVEFWVGRYSFDISFGFAREKVKIFSYENNVTNKWLQLTFAI
ncbi:MAG: hypothetical protein K1X54_10370 [Flavobacteriales bacterium]|nr:hypothetical protein [Flavobacteriales bacterium]